MHGGEVSCKHLLLLTKPEWAGLWDDKGQRLECHLNSLSFLFFYLLSLFSFILSGLLSPKRLGPGLRQLQTHNPID